MVFTPIQNWDQIAQTNIFPGESGGDYDALFGFQNRPGGTFAHVKPTAMTVGQVMDFTNPRGEYAQTVKGQIGRVATPVGAYQVVGTTLRAAVEGLGLDPNMPFDKNTQDMIGQWIYANQGPGAWEAWGKGGGGGGPASVNPMTASTKGGDMNPLAYMMGGQDFPMFDPGPTKGDRWRGGLVAAGEALTSLGAGRGPTFEQTDAFLKGEMARRMAQHSAQGEYGARQDATAQQAAAKNATAQWLATQGPKGEALAQAVLSGAMDGASAVAALTDPKAVLPGVDGAPTMDQEGLDKFAKEVRADLAPEVKIMSATNAAITGLQSALTSNNAMDIRSAVTLFSKLIDPTTGVLGGEAAAVLGSAGYVQGFIDTLNREIEGGGLTDSTRQQLVDAATRIAEARRKNFEATVGPLVDEAQGRGISLGLLGLPEYYGQPYTSPRFTSPPPVVTPAPRPTTLGGGAAPGVDISKEPDWNTP